MGQSATGIPKSSILRVRVTDELDARVIEMMVKLGFTGTKDQFTAWLVGKGLDLVAIEEEGAKHARDSYAASLAGTKNGRAAG